MSGGALNNSPFAFVCCFATASAILMVNACQNLGLVKRIAEVGRNDNQIVKDSVLKDYSSVIGTLGLLKDCVFQIQV